MLTCEDLRKAKSGQSFNIQKLDYGWQKSAFDWQSETMDGSCCVKGCGEATYMGWRPLTERRGRQICEYHWLRHKDEKDSFNLYEAFNFKRPAHIPRLLIKTETRRCDCGRALEDGHRFCTVCAKERERQRKRHAYHKRKNPEPEPIAQEDILKCRACAGPREPGYTYCPKCSRERQRQANQQRQRRHRMKRRPGRAVA